MQLQGGRRAQRCLSEQKQRLSVFLSLFLNKKPEFASKAFLIVCRMSRVSLGYYLDF